MHNAKRQEQRIEKNEKFRTARMRMKKMNFHVCRLLNFDPRKSNDFFSWLQLLAGGIPRIFERHYSA
jgi:hypothetical protein